MRGMKRKVVVLFLLIGLVPLGAASLLSFFSSQKALKQVIGSSQRDLAIEVMDKIDREIEFALTLEKNWIIIPEITHAMVAGSQRPSAELKADWERDGLTTTPTAILLKRLEATTENRLKEVVITDKRGHVIAATNKTSDFDQGPEDDPPHGEFWWVAAVNDGEFLEEVNFDESAGVYSMKIAMGASDDGELLGVLMALYNMENVQNLVNAVSKGEIWHYELINQDGLIIATREAEREKIFQHPSVGFVKSVSEKTGENGAETVADAIDNIFAGESGFAIDTDPQGEKVLIGYARSKRVSWMLLSYIPLEDAYVLLYQQLKWFFSVSLIAAAAIFLISVVLARRVVSELGEKEALAQELQTAHNMQMGLMPKENPELEGFDITGRCLPANHVGGDFFQFFQLDGKVVLAMADVTGHAMEAAIPVVMFSGILKSQIEIGGAVGVIFERLNRSLYGALDDRTFVCFAMGELDPDVRVLRLGNAGCPYPYHFAASDRRIDELRLDAYPLGTRPDTRYSTKEIPLEMGDRVVFYSDGIIEAQNSLGELFGFERTAEIIEKGCTDGLSAERLLDRMIGEVKAFTGDTPQGDDQTVIVLEVKS